METNTYTNRYGEIYTFTPTSDGNIFWSGSFSYTRFAWPNDYSVAYKTYLEQGGTMLLEEFKKKVHEYDNETKEYVMGRELVSLITSDTTKIDMVDPPGGPYICSGMEWMGKIIVGLEPKDGGYVVEELPEMQSGGSPSQVWLKAIAKIFPNPPPPFCI